MAETRTVAVVVLAAGSSRRLGRPKQLVALEGKPLLQHVIDAAAAATVGEIVVVVGHKADDITAAVTLPSAARWVVNTEHSSGQASSLQAGLAALGVETERAVVVLGDQPGIDPATIRAVAVGPGPIRRASYRDGQGHPVAFDRLIWPELFGLTGDTGARAVIGRNAGQVVAVDIDTTTPNDVDTPEDVDRLDGVGISD